MAAINPYLTFNGNCREAMEFYKECFGGELALQTIGGSPKADAMPKRMQDCILHAALINGTLVLMASDCVPEPGLVRGNSVSLAVNCKTEEEIEILYKKLSAGGNADQPLANTFWGALFGGVTDRYGNQWMLSFDGNQKP